MSEENKIHPLNAKGKYYVDFDCCLDHSCYDPAPANFKWDEESCRTYVFKQPETPKEEALCKEMIDYCPVEAIHDDSE
ncbi:MAG: ferredoxin [Pyrinomonadaceae bacterium]